MYYFRGGIITNTRLMATGSQTKAVCDTRPMSRVEHNNQQAVAHPAYNCVGEKGFYRLDSQSSHQGATVRRSFIFIYKEFGGLIATIEGLHTPSSPYLIISLGGGERPVDPNLPASTSFSCHTVPVVMSRLA